MKNTDAAEVAGNLREALRPAAGPGGACTRCRRPSSAGRTAGALRRHGALRGAPALMRRVP